MPRSDLSLIGNLEKTFINQEYKMQRGTTTTIKLNDLKNRKYKRIKFKIYRNIYSHV